MATKGKAMPISYLLYPMTVLRDTGNDELFDELEKALDKVGERIADVVLRQTLAVNGTGLANIRREVQAAITDVFAQGASAGKRAAIIRYESLGPFERLAWALGWKRKV